jgi:bifunctional oligoribonuclease and PAP phosphatase NrnA
MSLGFIELAEQIKRQVDAATRILLHFHRNPDMDSVGSALGMYHALRGLGKEVTVIKGDSGMPQFLRHLPGYGEVAEKNYQEIDTSEFDLFLILDTATADRIFSEGPVVFPDTMRTAVIDHHGSNMGYGEINLIDPSYAAVGQMLADIFKLWNIPITEDIARCLLTAIYGDTGNFLNPNTSAATFAAAAELAIYAPSFTHTVTEAFNQNQKEEVQYLALALMSVEELLPGIAIACVSNAALVEHGLTKEHTKGGLSPSNTLRSVAEWLVGGTLVEEEPGSIRISLRTRMPERCDLSKVTAVLGGGGHPGAAGASLAGVPFEEAKQRLRDAFVAVYPDLAAPAADMH